MIKPRSLPVLSKERKDLRAAKCEERQSMKGWKRLPTCRELKKASLIRLRLRIQSFDTDRDNIHGPRRVKDMRRDIPEFRRRGL